MQSSLSPSEDEAQVTYYENRIKEQPVPVLQRHGVVDSLNEVINLVKDRARRNVADLHQPARLAHGHHHRPVAAERRVVKLHLVVDLVPAHQIGTKPVGNE